MLSGLLEYIDPLKIIQKYYKKDSKAYWFLTEHGKAVVKKALEAARNVKQLKPDLKFIKEAGMLHDIGILFTNEESIGCFGDKPYICHGYLGRELLEKEGLPGHALVCERHVGVGFTAKEIQEQKLPLPMRDMRPKTIEEEIICFADKFFSKTEEFLTKEKSLERIREGLKTYGDDKIKVFDKWVVKFGC